VLCDAVQGEFSALIAARDFATVKERAQAVLQKFRDDNSAAVSRLLARSHLALAKAHFAAANEELLQGRQIQSRQSYADARWSYLSARLLSFEDDDLSVEASYFAAVCYDKLAAVETDAAERARLTRLMIVRNYPKSEYAALARKELEAQR